MDLTNDTSEGEIDYAENMEEANLRHRSSHYRATPYPQQQLRFRWSTPANGANGQERDIVSPNFTFSPDHNICSPTMYDSGISNGFPYSPNVGSTVMYKFPAQHGNSRTNSSKFLAEDRNAQQYSEFSCVRRMWNIIKMFLFGTTISALAVLCFWCIRMTSTFNKLTMNQDSMIYAIVALTAIFAVVITMVLKSLIFGQTPNSDNWTISRSSLSNEEKINKPSSSFMMNYQNRHTISKVIILPCPLMLVILQRLIGTL